MSKLNDSFIVTNNINPWGSGINRGIQRDVAIVTDTDINN